MIDGMRVDVLGQRFLGSFDPGIFACKTREIICKWIAENIVDGLFFYISEYTDLVNSIQKRHIAFLVHCYFFSWIFRVKNEESEKTRNGV